jgi:hypothetical protein
MAAAGPRVHDRDDGQPDARTGSASPQRSKQSMPIGMIVIVELGERHHSTFEAGPVQQR